MKTNRWMAALVVACLLVSTMLAIAETIYILPVRDNREVSSAYPSEMTKGLNIWENNHPQFEIVSVSVYTVGHPEPIVRGAWVTYKVRRLTETNSTSAVVAMTNNTTLVMEPTFDTSWIYKEVDGQTIMLDYDKKKERISLRTKSISGPFVGVDKRLEILKSEVMKLTSTIGIVGEVKSEVVRKVRNHGGYPTWGPYSTSLKDGVYECLFFCEKVWFSEDGTINFQGKTEKPYGYYGYPEKE